MNIDETLKRKIYDEQSIRKIPIKFLKNLPNLNKRPGYTITKELDDYFGLDYTKNRVFMIDDKQIETATNLVLLLGSIRYFINAACVARNEKIILNFFENDKTFTTCIEKDSIITDNVKELLDAKIDTYYTKKRHNCPISLIEAYNLFGNEDFNTIIDGYKNELKSHKTANAELITNIQKAYISLKQIISTDKQIDILELSLRLFRAEPTFFDLKSAEEFVKTEIKNTKPKELNTKREIWIKYGEEFANLMHNLYVCEYTNKKILNSLSKLTK